MLPFYQDFQEKYYFFAMGTDKVNGRILCLVGVGEGRAETERFR
jgi:hypothetical protein